MSNHYAPALNPLSDSAVRLFFMARFLCFVAVVYLLLHWMVRRFSVKSNSKLLWFFSIVTAPLTRPFRTWTKAGATDEQVIVAALIAYGVLWLLIVVAEAIFRKTAI